MCLSTAMNKFKLCQVLKYNHTIYKRSLTSKLFCVSGRGAHLYSVTQIPVKPS